MLAVTDTTASGATSEGGLRILYHHRIVADDGMRVHLESIIDALRRAGHSVQVVGPATGSGGGPNRGFTARLARLRPRLPAWLGELLEIAYNIHAYRQLRAAARRFRPDVIYERYNLFLLAGVWAAARFDVPLILEVNAPLVEERRGHGRLSLVAIARRVEAAAWRGADQVLPVSRELARHVVNAGVPESRIRVIPNAVPEHTIAGADRASQRRDRGFVTFGFVGFVRPWHGLDRVLDVLAERRDHPAKLIVVGDGPARAELEGRAKSLGISECLTFTGAVAHDRVPDYLRRIDVALQPDVTAYASPLKLFEYMASGCAIIAPDRPNIREILTHEVTGLLFDPHAEGAFASAVDRLAGDPALRRRLGAAAVAEIRERGLTWEGNAVRIAEIASRLTGRRAPAEAPVAGIAGGAPERP